MNDDLISRQDVIKIFTELWECIGTIGDREEWEDVCVTTANEIRPAQPEITLESAIDYLHSIGWLQEHDRIMSASAQRWIPCSERMPEPGEEVFVYLWGRAPYLASVNGEGQWETDYFSLDAEDAPKAWIPLPEPWKGEDDDRRNDNNA